MPESQMRYEVQPVFVFLNGLRLGMACVVNINAHGHQTLASALAATGENGAATLGFHACAETELVLARPLGRLVSAFHRTLLLQVEKGSELYRLPRLCQRFISGKSRSRGALWPSP